MSNSSAVFHWPSRTVNGARCGRLRIGVLTLLGAGCVDPSGSDRGDLGLQAIHASVQVDFSQPVAVVPPLAYGMHASVYDNALHAPELPELLKAGGLTLLRYPGGGYADNYHWSNHSMTPFRDTGDRGYLAERSDFGAFVSVLERFGGTAMITVNYGSNLAGDGPGEPLAAAAWVAYANGDPGDPHQLGRDGTGLDWGAVGDWAGLRVAAPLPIDDGKNFLRIERPAPLGIVHWEIGNEVFGNGYYGEAHQFEHDGHVPYDGTPREGHPLLSGTAYGRGVVEFVAAMKAVDPAIQIGAVLNTPPRDYAWGPTWNADVLRECGEVIDFGIVHWYPTTQASELIALPATEIPLMAQSLRDECERFGGARAAPIELAMTELGGAPGHRLQREAPQSLAIFAADTYLTAIEQGFSNLDWLELHNGTYLDERSQTRGPAYEGIRLASLLASAGDTLVGATSDRSLVVVHAARRADGGHGILLINQRLPNTPPTTVDLEFSGDELEGPCERQVLATSAADTAGVLSGPERVEASVGSLTVELAGYSLMLLRCGGAD